jgi:hypothetical protein
MDRKRYNQSESESLLARLVMFAESGEDMSVSDGRTLLSELLAARIGDTLIGRDARRELREWTATQIRARQRSLAQFLRMFLVPIGFDIQIDRLRLGAARIGHGVALRVDGAAGDVLTFQTISLLRAAGVRRLQRCECGRVFARMGKQKSCSERCAKRYYMRRYRRGEAGRE